MKTMRTQAKVRFTELPKDYAALCRFFLPRPVHDAAEYANVAEVADAMALWRDDFTAGQADYFELLCSLLETYDAEHVKWPKIQGLDVLKHLLAEHGLAPADLSRILGGSRNLGAMILRGERNLTLPHIRTLAAHFAVRAEAFI
jgi:HTH-type transcriptional regulator/antitoxin HigA